MKTTASNAAAEIKTVLAIDVRNLTTRFGLFRATDQEPFATWTVTTRDTLTPDEAQIELFQFFSMITMAKVAEHGGEDSAAEKTAADANRAATPDAAIIASVVPTATRSWEEAARRLTKRRPFVVGPGLKTGVKMRYNDPSNIGADRIANVVAAKQRHDVPLVIVDTGATTNIEVVDEDGAFYGGIIAPGLETSARAVAGAAARLAPVTLKAPRAVIGKNTADAMQSGIVAGEVARSDGLIDAVWAELGYRTGIVIAGPDASLISALSRHEMHVDPDLTLIGLRHIFDLNRR